MILVAGVSNVAAFMPANTHKLIHQTALETPIDSELYNACMKYPSLCYSGNVLTDVSVIWYWTEGYKYAVTHSPNFCRNLIESATNDKEYACAVGGCMHQPADIESHNKMVEYAIEHSLLTNAVIHVFAEQKVDNWVEDNYPTIKATALNQMADYEQCMPLFKRVMLGYEEYADMTEEDVNNKFDKFIVEIQTSQTGYDTAFKSKGFSVNIKSLPFSIIAIYVILMLFWALILILCFIKLIKGDRRIRVWVGIILFGLLTAIFIYVFVMNAQGAGFKAVVAIAKPVSFFVPLGNSPEYYVDNAIDNSKAFLQNGQSWLTGTDASGFVNLETSDRKIMLWDYFILFILTGALVLFIYMLFKKNPNQKAKTSSYQSQNIGI